MDDGRMAQFAHTYELDFHITGFNLILKNLSSLDYQETILCRS